MGLVLGGVRSVLGWILPDHFSERLRLVVVVLEVMVLVVVVLEVLVVVGCYVICFIYYGVVCMCSTVHIVHVCCTVCRTVIKILYTVLAVYVYFVL